jgi:hypothetical protein
LTHQPTNKRKILNDPIYGFISLNHDILLEIGAGHKIGAPALEVRLQQKWDDIIEFHGSFFGVCESREVFALVEELPVGEAHAD